MDVNTYRFSKASIKFPNCQHVSERASYLAKLTRVKRVVSKSWATIKGPSTRINGILKEKIIVKTRPKNTLIPERVQNTYTNI